MTIHHATALLALIAFGLVQAFFGYRLFRILVGVIGALIGFFYAPEIIALVTGEVPGAMVAIAIGAGLAVAFALVAWYVFWLAVFAWGVSIGYAAGVGLFAAQPWLAAVIGIGVGALAILFQRILIVLLTALNGAWLVVSGAAYLFGQIAAPPRGLLFDPLLDIHAPVSLGVFVLTLILATVAAVYQLRDGAPMLGRRA
jgi:hypothetical protein